MPWSRWFTLLYPGLLRVYTATVLPAFGLSEHYDNLGVNTLLRPRCNGLLGVNTLLRRTRYSLIGVLCFVLGGMVSMVKIRNGSQS